MVLEFILLVAGITDVNVSRRADAPILGGNIFAETL
jgi:hypothetical protein